MVLDYATMTGSVCNVTASNTTVMESFNNIDLCSGTQGTFMNLDVNCAAHNCLICLDGKCFNKNFKPIEVKI
jgi:hypothetical protein